MKLLVVHLTELRELLQPRSVWPPHLEGAKQLAQEINDERRSAAGSVPRRSIQNP
jgi:hypothetical protein